MDLFETPPKRNNEERPKELMLISFNTLKNCIGVQLKWMSPWGACFYVRKNMVNDVHFFLIDPHHHHPPAFNRLSKFSSKAFSKNGCCCCQGNLKIHKLPDTFSELSGAIPHPV